MENEGTLKKIVIALAVVAAILVGTLAYVWISKNKLVDDLNGEKAALTEEMVALQNDYSILSTDNDSLNVQLEREREKVEQLIERVKKTEATNRSKIRQYEKELGTLRSIMKHYIVQIDSLNTLNTALASIGWLMSISWPYSIVAILQYSLMLSPRSASSKAG
mgnify:CR=1 FL=1